MRRRALPALLVVGLLAAGCAPSPSPTPGLTPGASELATPGGTPTPAPSAGAVSVELPSELRDGAWAHVDYPSGHLAAGLLGRPATFTRELGEDFLTNVTVAGQYLLLEDHPRIEVIDVVSGGTVGVLDLASLAEPGHELEAEPVEELRIDSRRALAYYLSSGTKGVVLRRFRLDGSGSVRLVTLAPSRAVEDWKYSAGFGFIIGTDGDVIATSCSPRDSTVRPDHRCRVYVMPPDATSAGEPSILPAGSPLPCDLVAAGRGYVVATTDSLCHQYSSGPGWLGEPFFVLSLRDASVHLVERDPASPGFWPRGLIEIDGTPWLLGEARSITMLYPDPYLPYYQAVWVDLSEGGGFASVTDLLPWDAEPEPTVNALLHVYGDWLLLQPLGPAYAACRLGDQEELGECPVGAAFLYHPADGRRIDLPVGTYADDSRGS